MEKKLGKIELVTFGHGGYQNCMLGLYVNLSGEGWGVPDGVYYGVVNIIINNELVSYPFNVSIFHN